MKKRLENPGSQRLRQELDRVQYNKRYRGVIRSTIYVLLTVAAVAVLVATLLLPVLRIYGASMTPSLNEGDIVVSVKGMDFDRGDVVSFYYNNKILVKRVVAFEGEWVNIDENGNVYVNGTLLDEPYLTEKAFGECDIQLPYQVPDERYFLMGDNRSVSVDSRNTTVGCISRDQIVGKVIFRIWPLSEFGPVR